MSRSPAKRRRSSVEEGPTIYKCDQLRRMLEEALKNPSRRHSNTDPIKFLGNFLLVRTEANGKSRPKGDEDDNPGSARFHSFCTQLANALKVSKTFVVKRITQQLLHDDDLLNDLCDHLTAATEHYDLAMALIKDEPLNRPVTIRIGTTNLINMRVLPAVLEAVRQRFRLAYPEVQLSFVQTIMDSEELLFGTQAISGVDAVVACCLDARLARISRAELVASMPLRPCLLKQRDRASKELVRAHSFDDWQALRGMDMVALATRRNHFDVPWSDIESMMDSIEEVPTLLEAHARVAASDAWTMSYRELMDEADERNLESLDLPRDSQRQAPHIVAVLPQEKKARRSRLAKGETDNGIEKRMALVMLKECLQLEFEERKRIRRQAEELTHWLSRFRFSYHVSDYAPRNGETGRRIWFAGRANLACTSIGNLTGAFSIGNPAGAPLHVRVFGRPIAHSDGSMWHLQWRGVDPHEESGTTNMVVSRADLKEGQFLLGNWVGRSSWTSGDVRPSGGPFILHTRDDLTPRGLKRLVLSHQEHCVPDLRNLSNELIPISGSDLPGVRRKPR